MARHSNNRTRAGLSLVEVLVALAIFVIGILAVLRIFPKSLGIITTNRDRTDAVRLAQQRLEELRADESKLPDAIFAAGLPTDVNPANTASFGFLRIGAGVDMNRPYDFATFAGANGWTDTNDPQALYRYLAANRLVVGERAIVPRGIANQGYDVSPSYTLFGPIDTTGAAPAVEVFREFSAVSPPDLRISRVGGVFQDRPVFAFVDGGIDSFTHQPAPDRLLFELENLPRQLIVRYAYQQNGNVVWTQMAGATSQLAATTGAPVTNYQVLVLGSPDVIASSVSVRQPLAHGGTGRFTFDDGPANLGYLRLPPTQAGEVVSLEYVVQDWRLLHETVSIPFSGGLPQNQATGPLNNGLLQLRTTDLDDTFRPLLVIKQTGQQLTVNLPAWLPDVAKLGQVPVNLTAPGGAALPDGTYEVTVWFRKWGNWAVAPTLAPSTYILEPDAQTLAGGSSANYPVQSTIVEPVVTAALADGYHADLLFRPSEAGRTVLVNYEIDTPNGRQAVNGEMHVVPPRTNLTTAGGKRHAIRLMRPLSTSAAPASVGAYLKSIEGLSLQVRVVYNDQNLVRPNVDTVTGQAAGDSRQRLYELNWLVRRHR